MFAKKDYNTIFQKLFDVSEEEALLISKEMAASWGSLTHMELITAIEDTFRCSLLPEDILGFVSYDAGINILKSKGIILE